METDLSLCFKGGIGLSESKMGRHFKFKEVGHQEVNIFLNG